MFVVEIPFAFLHFPFEGGWSEVRCKRTVLIKWWIIFREKLNCSAGLRVQPSLQLSDPYLGQTVKVFCACFLHYRSPCLEVGCDICEICVRKHRSHQFNSRQNTEPSGSNLLLGLMQSLWRYGNSSIWPGFWLRILRSQIDHPAVLRSLVEHASWAETEASAVASLPRVNSRRDLGLQCRSQAFFPPWLAAFSLGLSSQDSIYRYRFPH